MTASYTLSAALRNRASRVARPRTSGRTPLAEGSSVPGCPMRRSPNARRTRATTSCEVGPTGLLSTIRPSIDRVFDLLEEDRPQLFDRTGDRAARGVLVAAPPEFAGDGGHVYMALRAHAD